MAPFSPIPARHPIRVILSPTALLRFVPARRAAAVVVAQLGMAAFFVAGIVGARLGSSAGWVVLAAAGCAALVRAVDLESWSLLVPGGFVGRIVAAYGPRWAGLATASAFVERLLLSALATVVVGHYMASVVGTALAGFRFTGHVRPEDLATILAIVAIGLLWVATRLGREIPRQLSARAVWIGLGIVTITIAWAALTVASGHGHGAVTLLSFPPEIAEARWPALAISLAVLAGFSLAFTAVGSGEALLRVAHEFPPPRVESLRRTSLVALAFAFAAAAGGTFLVALSIPAGDQSLWANAPLVGLAEHVAGPAWLMPLVSLAVGCSAALVLLPAAHAAMGDTEQMMHRASSGSPVPRGLASLHERFGTPLRAADMTAVAVILVIIAGGGRVAWLARGYAVALAVMIVLSVGALLRLRSSHPQAAYRVPGNVRIGRRRVPLGLIAAGAAAAVPLLAMVLTGDVASIATCALIAVLTAWRTSTRAPAAEADDDTVTLLLAAELSPGHVDARPGNVLVPVRNPHLLAHVAAALRTPGDRDIVIMTVRLIDVDIAESAAAERTPTPSERQLFSDVIALAERFGRPVQLLIVPAHSVVDAIVGTAIRLRSSDVYVGESLTLSAADQARLLGESWERADKPEALDVRLVIYHRSGRADTYHLGAHAPALTARDLDLIHRVWLDAVKAVGPHVHHHDVVRAALIHMDHQLNSPQRDEMLAAIRDVARPAEELASVLRAGDYARLRDILRNRHPGDVAQLLTELSVEDQAVVFRVLPRESATDVFEYLSHDAKATLLRAMAQDDVARLLNSMAPDDRTMFLEELPAAATRELLALLTPAERAVALTLLGYPEQSVGRLMTPHYVAVQEPWTVRETLDYVRTHGQDSETLNHIYVVDDRNALVDDIRIREFLLAPLDKHVADLMDRHFVALKATDTQEAAVAVFREYDRTALPVTDTAGVLIGIVTIDDMLDVAEATATREIQRIGGSEALDEPYMEIPLIRMIQKRAGWLTALFLGEMLTATAMGAFEHEISRAVVLALFVPLIISSGGNSGSQASTLVIRALALGEVRIRDWWLVMRRELLAGVALGGILGAIGFLRISLWSAFSDIYGPHWLLVALTVAIALVGVVLWGTLSGSLLPFLLKRLGFDPAASSAPFVATLVDVTGLVIYFSVAVVVLRGTLL